MAATAVTPPRHHHLSAQIRHHSNPHLPNTFLLNFPKSHHNRFSTSQQLGQNSIQKLRNFGAVNSKIGAVMGDFYGDDMDDDDDEDDEEEDEDRSLDLLIRFVENVFKKVSKKARKAVKSVLPVPISAKLVGFAVNGTIILTFLWVLRAFLEVICTLGSMVFGSILLIRGIWTGISYFQDSRRYRADDDEPQAWSRSQPAI